MGIETFESSFKKAEVNRPVVSTFAIRFPFSKESKID